MFEKLYGTYSDGTTRVFCTIIEHDLHIFAYNVSEYIYM